MMNKLLFFCMLIFFNGMLIAQKKGQVDVNVKSEMNGVEIRVNEFIRRDSISVRVPKSEVVVAVAQKEGFKTREFVVFDKSKVQEIPNLLEITMKDSSQKYINYVAGNVGIVEGDLIGKAYSNYTSMTNAKEGEDILSDYYYSILPEDLNLWTSKFVMELGFLKSNSTVYSNDWNVTNLRPSLKEIGCSTFLFDKEKYASVMLSIDWLFFDSTGDTLLKKSVESISEFNIIYRSKSSFNLLIKDALFNSLLILLSQEDSRQLLSIGKDVLKGDVSEEVFIDSYHDFRNLGEQRSSIVKVRNNKRNSTGTIISNQGHVISTFDVLNRELEDTFDILINGMSYEAIVLTTNEKFNLSLLKVVAPSDVTPLSVEEVKINEIGDGVYALSFSELELLNAYASRGIISGQRNFLDTDILQIDVPMSGGNAGGALLNSNGKLIGILSEKISSISMEGVGFAIPIETVFSLLKIKQEL